MLAQKNCKNFGTDAPRSSPITIAQASKSNGKTNAVCRIAACVVVQDTGEVIGTFTSETMNIKNGLENFVELLKALRPVMRSAGVKEGYQ